MRYTSLQNLKIKLKLTINLTKLGYIYKDYNRGTQSAYKYNKNKIYIVVIWYTAGCSVKCDFKMYKIWDQ